MIIILNGPLGIGKTSLSWELLSFFDRGVMLDGDFIGAVQPFEIYDPQRIDYLYQTLRVLVEHHQANGYRNFVINYVFEEPESLARLRCLLSQLDGQNYAFRLVCAPDEIDRRIRLRGAALAPEQLARELFRAGQLSEILQQAARRGDLGFVVDTTALNERQAAQVIWEIIHEKVILSPYQVHWKDQFAEEKERLQMVLGNMAVRIHHIGSTAVPGLSAKPVIDLMVEIPSLEQAEQYIQPLQSLGYSFIDHPENSDRRFFRKGMPRSHHLHLVAQGSAVLADHIDFRDALRSNPALCQAYQNLKEQLAQRFPENRRAYTDHKNAFVLGALQDYRNRLSG